MDFKISCLEYAYTSNGLVNIDSANKSDSYFLDKELSIPLIYCSGEKNIPYWRKVSNISAEDLKRVFGGSESIEHYNKKIEISQNLYIEDSFGFKKWFKYSAHSSKVEYYIKEINKIVDVAFFDEDGEVFIYIEVFYKNKKTQADIDKFNKLNVVVYEYDIQKRRCYPISAGISYKEQYYKDRERIANSRKYIQTQRKEIKKFKAVSKEYYEIKRGVQNLKARINSKREQIEVFEDKTKELDLNKSFKNYCFPLTPLEVKQLGLKTIGTSEDYFQMDEETRKFFRIDSNLDYDFSLVKMSWKYPDGIAWYRKKL